ncbi:NUDIX hydrolase [Occultella gossypii]|uniref:NUDIX domain-containing protein n=1 Tax=Occultella gossypii TaxID=2800820 RepID=A0ABS7SF13_9MICO|nr:NUDIX domain-containing protein [Occultella gossypii]MBZ2198929.1 NUDIX domain-containing protein [Occultella gossypii]
MDTRPASYVVAVRDGAVLLAHWNEGGRTGWTLPGGGMEDDESTEETAIREFREETGYDVALDGLLGVDTHYVAAADRLSVGAGPLRSVRIIYAGHIVGGELTHEIDGSTDECRWVPLEEVAGLDTVSLVGAAMAMVKAR